MCCEAVRLESKRRMECAVVAARGLRCCVIFGKCLEPQRLVSEAGQESISCCSPQLLYQLCVHLQVHRQQSKEGVIVSY